MLCRNECSEEVRDLRKGVEVIIDPEKARVLVDPMRREMLRLLAERPMTEKQLAQVLGLSDPSVAHHLKILKQAGFVRIARKEVEEHGIVQKFYETNALAYFIDERRVPLEIERYFMPVSSERARGILAGLNIVTDRAVRISAEELEAFAKALNSAIVRVASRYSKPLKQSREEVIGLVYRDALSHLLGKLDLLPENVRSVLLHARMT